MRKLALNGILVSLALVLSLIERFIPLSLIVPIPGVKLGLANIVTMFALFYTGFGSAFTITVLRCVLASLLFGGLSSLVFSVTGALLALFVMAYMKLGYDNIFTLLGISMGGAAFHNVGQILAASLLMRNAAVFYYLPFLLLAGIVTGLVTAVVSENLFVMVEKTNVVKHYG